MLSLRTKPTGRGRNYSLSRGLVESALRIVYASSWPAKLWERIPTSTHVRLVHHRLYLPNTQHLKAPLRIAFASDLHLGPTTSQRTLDEAFRLLSSTNPDVLILGGDYVFLDATPTHASTLQSLVFNVSAKTKIAVLGNHDLWTDHPLIEQALASAGAIVLVNASVRLPPPHDNVAIVGLDDPWTGQPNGSRAFQELDDTLIKIAVCHAPGGLSHIRHRDVALYLCGHTDGGQIALPGHRPVILPGGRYARMFPYGLHRFEGIPLFVSRGVGGVELPMRLYAPPDVALLEIGNRESLFSNYHPDGPASGPKDPDVLLSLRRIHPR